MYLKFLQKPRCVGWFKTCQCLFPFVSFIFLSILKCKTLVLKTTTWWTRASHFVDGWHLLRCQIRFFPTPYVVDHVTFLGEGGYGWFSLGKNFFQKPLELEIFFLTYNGVRFFSALYTSWAIFFSVQDIIFPKYILASLSLSKSVCRIPDTFFLKLPITSSKVKLSAAKIHLPFAQ